MTATREGVVLNRRAEQLAEIHQKREAELDREIKESGEAGGIGALQRDSIPEGDPLRPENIPAAEWDSLSDEAKGEALKAVKSAEQPAEPEAEAPAEEPAAAPVKTEKLKIDGQEQEVELDKIMDAGRRALQKELAADKRLEEATQARAEAERLRQSVEETLAKLPKEEQPKKTDKEMVLAKDGLRDIVKKIQYGSEDEAAEALAEYGTKMAAAGQPGRLTEAELNNILDLREAQRFVKTNYEDVMGDENLKSLFVTKVNQKLAAGDSRPYQDICKDIGDEIRTWRGAPQKQEPTPQGGSRAAVKERKTSIVQIPSASARQPAPTKPKEPSPSETIDKMRAARRQA